MNKDYLEALGLVKRTCELYIDSIRQRDLIGWNIIENQINEALEIIKHRLEAIDQSETSEALKCLERIRDFLLNKTKEISFQDLRDIEQTLLKIQSQEDKARAFDLINEKDIDIKLLKWAYPNVEAYNAKVREQKDYWWRKELTPEEFEFIGKVAGAK